jgi:ribosomal-protein-alanine N-acetyltransferase
VVNFWPATLEQGQVRLRPLRYRDEAAWSEIRNRGRTWFQPWDATRPANSREVNLSFAQLIRSYLRRARKGLVLPWAVEYAPEGGKPVFAGQVTISGISFGSASWGQVGYWIDPKWAGRGIIPLAVAMATDYCFETVGLHRIEIAIRPENTNSLAVPRKLGFRYEGRRENYMHVAGDWRDHDVYVLHAGDIPEGVVARFLANR